MVKIMKQNLLKSLCFIVVVMVSFSICTNVNAAAIDCQQRYNGKDRQIIEDFGMNIVKSGHNYTITVNPKGDNANMKEKLRKVVFKVSKINPASGNDDLIGKKVKYDSPLTLSVSGGGNGAEITLKADLNGNGVNLCSATTATIKITLSATDYNGNAVKENENVVVKVSDDELQKVEQGTQIECENYASKYNSSSFEYNFCLAKTEAQKHAKFTKSKDVEKGYTMVNFTNAFDANGWKNLKYDDVVKKPSGSTYAKARQFQCKAKVSQKYEDAIKNDENYYRDNVKYMYGSGEKTYTAGTYKYHFHNEKVTNGKTAQCKVVCEESVIVKYGPPVATRAGACFEYKIKVESRVSCYMSQKPEKPDVYKEVCTPHPRCVATYGAVYNQGGPNEDYDQCINECDGGKYTDKCNNKCYQEVYMSNSSELPISYDVERTANANAHMTKAKYASIAKNASGSKGGYYYRSGGKTSGGSISWSPGGSKGRWYYHHAWGFAGHNYSIIHNGIPRTPVCTDSCYWPSSECTGKRYLNYGLSDYDKEQNIAIYNKAVEKCKAKATCTSATAQYTINASYEKPTTETTKVETWIDFPKTAAKKDKLSTCRYTGTKTNTSGTVVSTILDYQGCYVDACTTENYYMTEWSFPDNWVRKKTGEVSYVKPETLTGWRTKPDRFCLPPDAGAVNKDWARWYYRTIEKVPENYVCPWETSGDTGVGKVSKYNIKGNTTHFGYYEWNIDMKCFYALDDTYTDKTTSGDGVSCKKQPNPEYRIRTVTNNELFPSDSGTSTSSGSTAGRTPGYNWTSDSALTDKVIIPGYVNDPTKVKEYIQKVGNSIYNGQEYVDYEFVLTPNDLREIKDYNAKRSGFDIFCGKLIDQVTPLGQDQETGITSYRSNLFRSGIDANTWTECANARNGFIRARQRVSSEYLFCNNNDGAGACKTF